MRYLVTGGTGLIGRHLVPLLLARGRVTLLVRPATQTRLKARLDGWSQRGDLEIEQGDLTDSTWSLRTADFDHVFHLAGCYDLGADTATLRRVNVDGTRRLLEELERRTFAGTLHHASSIAVAGTYEGTFTEAQFDEGQAHPHPYHRSKYDAEQLVRASSLPRVRIYRPSAVVGHARTGEMDRIDGPYYLFEVVDRLRKKLPPWFPLAGLDGGTIDMVPVDWVAAAFDRIAHAPGQDGRTFHLTDPNAPSFRETFNLIADAACAPRLSTKKSRVARLLPGAGQTVASLGSTRFLRARLLEDLGVPVAAQRAINRSVTFDATHTSALVEPPPHQRTYVAPLWDHYVRHLATSSHPEDAIRRHFRGQRVLVTGASSGIGASLAESLAAAGAHVLLVARREVELGEVVARIRAADGNAEAFVVDLADYTACDDLVARVVAEHGGIDVLINNAGRSIRRTLLDSLDRFHDLERVMQINYFAPARLIRGFLPGMVERKSGAIVNVLSAGAHMPSPRFGAYTASKAALSQLGDTLAAEHAADGIRVTQAYLHFVRTPMMSATREFDDNEAMTPDAAARWILEGTTHGVAKLVRPTDLRRYVLNQVAPRTISRLVNVVYRLYADEHEGDPELAFDRSLARRFFAGRPM